MADADRDDAGKEVQVPPASVVPEPLHMTLVDQDGVFVIRHSRRRHVGGTNSTYVRVRRTLKIERHIGYCSTALHWKKNTARHIKTGPNRAEILRMVF